MQWLVFSAFACGAIIGIVRVAYVSTKVPSVNAKKPTSWKRYLSLPIIFSVIGLILLVYSLIVNDWEGGLSGAFLFLAFLTPYLHRKKHITLSIFHGLSLLVLGILGYYVFQRFLLSILPIILGIAGLIDVTRLITRKTP